MKKIYYKKLITRCPYSNCFVGGTTCVNCIYNKGLLIKERAIFCDLEDKKTKFSKRKNLLYLKNRYVITERKEIFLINIFSIKTDYTKEIEPDFN